MERFNYEQQGYSRSEVNKFVQDVINQTEGIIRKYQEQKKEISTLKNEIDTYKTMEDALKRSIIQAENTSDNIKRLAKEEAALVVSDAKSNASRIVNEALLRADKIEANADMLERNMRIFKRKLKAVIEQQLAVVEEIEILELE